jgi:hypothetical protein
MNLIEQALHAADRRQQRSQPMAFALPVVASLVTMRPGGHQFSCFTDG